MRRLRTVALAAAAALAITATWVPVTAAGKGDVAIVNGIPGAKVDICLDGREIRSKLPYGKATFKRVAAGGHRLKVVRRDPRTCRGKLLSERKIWLPAGGDKTIVATKRRPKKFVVFSNDGLGRLGTPPIRSYMSWAWRHAADVGVVSFRRDQSSPTPFAPAADPPWAKGQEFAQYVEFFAGFAVIVTLVQVPDSRTIVAGPIVTGVREGYRHEWLLVGTTLRNARIVTLKRPIDR